jgi:uncharacterized membrane protein YjfL (UPF0719 family)
MGNIFSDYLLPAIIITIILIMIYSKITKKSFKETIQEGLELISGDKTNG